MEKNVVLNEAKFEEFKAVKKAINETVKKEDRARVCLENKTLRKMAGFEQADSEDRFNPYVKDMLDKFEYDEHERSVSEAKKANDKEELKRLSNKAMRMAGYIRDEQTLKVNPYAKSFVDRTLMQRELNKLYVALENDNQEGVDNAYRAIYQMSSYGSGVVNECAQAFVELNIDKYKEKGIHVELPNEEKQGYAI